MHTGAAHLQMRCSCHQGGLLVNFVALLVHRWEAHLWVKELGRQVYLGGYEQEEHAAEAYDVAALKCKGCRVRTNFPVSR
jgi:hypothetical protein